MRKPSSWWAWPQRIERKLDFIMSTFTQLQVTMDALEVKVGAIKTDTEAQLALIAELKAKPPTGMTAEQQAALDAIEAKAESILATATATDAEANPTPTPPPAQ